LQDVLQVAGKTAVHGAHGQRLGPHSVVGKAMDGDKRSCGKFTAEFCQSRKIEEFKIHDGERSPEASDRASNIFFTFDSCESNKLSINRSRDALRRRRIVVSKNDTDWPHGNTPFSSRYRRFGGKKAIEQCSTSLRRREEGK
jgi:hypothetical protein